MQLSKIIEMIAPIDFQVPPSPPAHVQSISNFKNAYQDPNFVLHVAAYIEHNEGYRNRLYRDSKGNWTIGIGHLVHPEEIHLFQGRKLSHSEIDALFLKDLMQKMNAIHDNFGDVFSLFSNDLKAAIVDGYFRGDLAKSPNTVSLLKQRRFKEAAKEYLNNAEYRAAKTNKSGVAVRMERNAKMMWQEN